jgi:hypothetical protein
MPRPRRASCGTTSQRRRPCTEGEERVEGRRDDKVVGRMPRNILHLPLVVHRERLRPLRQALQQMDMSGASASLSTHADTCMCACMHAAVHQHGAGTHVGGERLHAGLEQGKLLGGRVEDGQLAVRAGHDVIPARADSASEAVKNALVLVHVRQPLPEVRVHLEHAHRRSGPPHVPQRGMHVVPCDGVDAVLRKLEAAWRRHQLRVVHHRRILHSGDALRRKRSWRRTAVAQAAQRWACCKSAPSCCAGLQSSQRGPVPLPGSGFPAQLPCRLCGPYPACVLCGTAAVWLHPKAAQAHKLRGRVRKHHRMLSTEVFLAQVDQGEDVLGGGIPEQVTVEGMEGGRSNHVDLLQRLYTVSLLPSESFRARAVSSHKRVSLRCHLSAHATVAATTVLYILDMRMFCTWHHRHDKVPASAPLRNPGQLASCLGWSGGHLGTLCSRDERSGHQRR